MFRINSQRWGYELREILWYVQANYTCKASSDLGIACGEGECCLPCIHQFSPGEDIQRPCQMSSDSFFFISCFFLGNILGFFVCLFKQYDLTQSILYLKHVSTNEFHLAPPPHTLGNFPFSCYIWNNPKQSWCLRSILISRNRIGQSTNSMFLVFQDRVSQ